MVSLLIDSGADVDKANNNGHTPLFVAVQVCADLKQTDFILISQCIASILQQSGHTDIACKLLRAGANPDIYVQRVRLCSWSSGAQCVCWHSSRTGSAQMSAFACGLERRIVRSRFSSSGCAWDSRCFLFNQWFTWSWLWQRQGIAIFAWRTFEGKCVLGECKKSEA